MAFILGGSGAAPGTLISSSIPSTDNAIARYDGITGLLMEDSGMTISDANAVVIPGGGSLSVAALSGVLQATAGLISGGADSDDVPEGAVNFFYTEARFDSSFTGKSTTDLSEGTNLYYTQARFDAAFTANDTDDLSEGALNLYYTEGRVSANTDVAANTAARHSHANKAQLDLVSDGDHDVRTDNPHTVTATQVGLDDTDDLAEGAINFYYTGARFDSSFAAKDTDGLSEGATNLYYTQARFDTAFALENTVAGPASSTDNALARYDSTTGKILLNSFSALSDTGALGIGPDFVEPTSTEFLTITNNAAASGTLLVMRSNVNTENTLVGDANPETAGQELLGLQSRWNGVATARIQMITDASPGTKTATHMVFTTRSDGGVLTEALDIGSDQFAEFKGKVDVAEDFSVGTDVFFVDESTGVIGINAAAPDASLQVSGGSAVGGTVTITDDTAGGAFTSLTFKSAIGTLNSPVSHLTVNNTLSGVNIGQLFIRNGSDTSSGEFLFRTRETGTVREGFRILETGNVACHFDLQVDADLNHDGTNVGFYGTAPVAQGAAISDPAGGATVDAEARAAINDLIDRLQAIGIIL